MKITLDEELISSAVKKYLMSKGFTPKNVEIKRESGTYGDIIAIVDLEESNPIDDPIETTWPEDGAEVVGVTVEKIETANDDDEP